MDDDSYGAYTLYFSILKNFGAFPYNLDGHSNKRLKLCDTGPHFCLYIVNFAAASFHAFFQLFQLIFVFMDGVDMVQIIGQLTWTLLSALPISNYLKSMGEERHFAGIVDEWCHLERRIIGSTFRGMGKNRHSPTLSTCHFNQKDRVTFISRYYVTLGLVGAVTVGSHAYLDPKCSSYIYSLTDEESDLLKNLSVAYQLWIYSIIWSNIYAIEVLTTMMSSSVGHILETLSYKGGVVMTRWTCDHIPVHDLINNLGTTGGLDGNDNHHPGSAILDKANRKGSGIFEGTEDLQDFFPKSEMSKIIQNLVDIEYGLEGYLRVESLIEAFNHSFGRMIPGHQFVYLIMLTIQGFNAIQYFSTMDPRGVAVYLILMALFLLRMLTFFPAMGNLDHRSDSFIDSWMEGLRYIPKGKQSYELYWYRIKSCRLLDFRCGRYFNMERQTCLEFLFRVSEFVIVLMQISY